MGGYFRETLSHIPHIAPLFNFQLHLQVQLPC